jgi:hypothetical protein
MIFSENRLPLFGIMLLAFFGIAKSRFFAQKSPPGSGLFLLFSRAAYMLHPEAGHST